MVARENLAVLGLLLGAAVALFAASPTDGNFWWSDAPRHALNGAFVLDFVKAFPVDDPRGWAVDYYLRYPALTILFYPPLFYVVEAAVFAIVGVSHGAAQATVVLFFFALLVASYGIARNLLPRWSAAGAALLVAGAPEVSYWARQVMLDIPAYAMVAAGAYFLVAYIRESRPRALFGLVLSLLAAAWIKLTAVFFLPICAVVLLAFKGRGLVRDRQLIGAALLGLAGLVPLLWMTSQFGSANLESVAGRPTDLSRWSLGAWLFYARSLTQSIGVPQLVAAAAGAVLLTRFKGSGTERVVVVLLAVWFAWAYLFFSFIGVREPRHGLMMLLPCGIAAAFAVDRLMPRRFASLSTLALGAAVFAGSLIGRPAPEVNGYRDAAAHIARTAPLNGVVVFHGTRDGSFVFNLRALGNRHDLTVLRSDKLLLRVLAGERVRGVRELDLDEDGIRTMLKELGVSAVVIQRGFWADVKQMQRFERVITAPGFSPVTTFTVTANVPHEDAEVEVWAPTYPVSQVRRVITMQMPMLRDVFTGQIGPR